MAWQRFAGAVLARLGGRDAELANYASQETLDALWRLTGGNPAVSMGMRGGGRLPTLTPACLHCMRVGMPVSGCVCQ